MAYAAIRIGARIADRPDRASDALGAPWHVHEQMRGRCAVACRSGNPAVV